MRLIDNWRIYAFHSLVAWASGAIGAVLALVFANYGIFFAVIPFLPTTIQLPAAALCGGVALWGAITGSRLIEQPKLAAKVAEKVAEKVEEKQQEAADANLAA